LVERQRKNETNNIKIFTKIVAYVKKISYVCIMKELTFKSVEQAVEELKLEGNYKSFCGYLHQCTKRPRPEAVFINGNMVKIENI